jgi:hypothetical protein
MLNTRNDNCDLSNRRAYGYTINNNDWLLKMLKFWMLQIDYRGW